MHIEVPLIEIGALDQVARIRNMQSAFWIVFWSIFGGWWSVRVDKHEILLGKDDEGVR